MKVVGKSGRTNGSLSGMFATPDGRHRQTFNANGDWLRDGSLHLGVIEAEFCGKTGPPTPEGELADSLARSR